MIKKVNHVECCNCVSYGGRQNGKTYGTLMELAEKLQKIERYIDARADIPLEVKINIKNVIHSKDEEE